MSTRVVRRLVGACASIAACSSVVQAQEIVLDGIVVTSSKVSESAIDALSGSSALSKEELDTQFQPDRVSQVLRTLPGVTTQETARDTGTAVNIRGLQDFGRVNVLVDGARQNFQRSGHSANGVFYIDPEMIKRVDVTRGPTATIYGSGAIGGVAAFELIDADDILRDGEYAAIQLRTRYGTNDDAKTGSATAAVRAGNFDIVGQVNDHRSNDFTDGSGNEVAGSNDRTGSEFAKLRWRPAEGHQITASIIDYSSDFVDEVEQDGSRYDTEVGNRQYTLGYTLASPTNPLIDFSAKIYRNDTRLDQVRLTGGSSTFFSTVGGIPFSIGPIYVPDRPLFINPGVYPVGATRGFETQTEGFDVFNTSRFTLSDTVSLALTYGVDAFQDHVRTEDIFGNGDEFTPAGERSIYGTFVQSKWSFAEIVDVIGALRYDSYEMQGNGVSLSDDHISPKLTVGVTPVKGVTVFGTYADGFRAPALSESLISGFHPGFAHFQIRPNPDLKPEEAENIEVGVNLKADNIVTTGDAFRAKVTAFKNDVTNYIDQVFVEGPIAGVTFSPIFPGPPQVFFPIFEDDYLQYRNVRNATIEGVELEAYYDARSWFAGVTAHRIRGTNDDTGSGLYTIPADQVAITLGFRALGDSLTAGVRTRIVDKQDRFEEADTASRKHAEAYTAVDLFAEYKATEDIVFNANVDNLFNETYRQHLDQYNSAGLNARLGVSVRFGAK